jgi:hypothetical protein
METADDYAKELLRRLERQLTAFVSSVQSGIDQLEEPRGAGPAITADLPGEVGEGAPPAAAVDQDAAVPAGTTITAGPAEALEPVLTGGAPLPAAAENGETAVIDDLQHDRLDDDPTAGA